MPPVFGNLIVVLILAIVVALCIRSLWKGRKKGGCSGDCASCGGCHGHKKAEGGPLQ